jgi:hypothetical protein
MKAATVPAGSSGIHRLAWCLWVVCSLVEAATLLVITDPRLDPRSGLPLTALLPIQALVVPALLRRSHDTHPRQAAARGAACGLASSAVALALFRAGAAAFNTRAEQPDAEALRIACVWTLLVVAGFGNGIMFGWLRARSLATDRTEAAEPSVSRYLRSAGAWLGAVMVCCWMWAAVAWVTSSEIHNLEPVGWIVGSTGVLWIAPIPALFPVPAAAGRFRRIWRHARRALAALGVLWLAATILSLAAYSLLVVYLIHVWWSVLVLWVPCWVWALLYGLGDPGRRTERDRPVVSRSTPWWMALVAGASAHASAVALAVAALTTPALGLAGIGCRATYRTSAAEYWFWHAYKGVGARDESPQRIVFRPAIDRTACLVILDKERTRLNDDTEVTLGYAAAARTWYWLADPDQWDSARTAQIRRELARLLGREFSMPGELEAWWTSHAGDLVWSGTDERLDVRPKTSFDLAHPRTSPRMRYPATPESAVEVIRHHWQELDPARASSFSRGEIVPFRAALLDPDARLRGLTLAAADAIRIVSGEEEREGRDAIARVMGRTVTSKAEAQAFFATNPPPGPLRVWQSRAREWIALVETYGPSEQYRRLYVDSLRELTGKRYSTPEEFLPWLLDPANVRGDEWLRARDAVNRLPDDGGPPIMTRLAMDWLRDLTGERLATPDAWVAWWAANRHRLALARDRRHLSTSRD